MKKLAIIVTRGALNNLLQACELAKLAAGSGTHVSIFFRDEAAAKLTLQKIKDLTFSDTYRGRESRVRELLRERKQQDLAALLREIKETGDAKFSICRRSMELFELKVEDLIPELDEVQAAESFWKEEVATADQVLTF